MSEIVHTIRIASPELIGSGNMKEVIHSSAHRCDYCHGNGFFWGERCRERVKEACPVCGGSGKLDAVITIEWKPSGNRP